VERLVDSSPEATKLLLDRLAGRGQRFLTAATPPPAETEPPRPANPPGSYIVQPGDTLSLIAQKVYGEAHLWSLIFEANRDKISNPNLIRVGMALLIPERKAS
jgi:nucleoid-associated protein YgaU